MFKRTRMIVLAGLFFSCTGMAFEVDKGKINAPDEAIAALQAGNERFATGEMINQDFGKQIESTSGDKLPYAAILSCLD